MAAMSTTLKVYSDNGDSRTYSLSGTTVQKPRLVLQKRKVGTNVTENMISVSYATEDDDGAVLPQRATITVTAKTPIQGQAADMTAVLGIIRDIIAGDEFAASLTSNNFLDEEIV